MNQDQFEIPADTVGQMIHVSLRGISMQTPNGQTVPGFLRGTMRSQTNTSLTLNVVEPGIYGPPGDVTLPKESLLAVNKTGSVSLVPPGARIRT